MKSFRELEIRLENLLAGLDGDLWRRMMSDVKAPGNLPSEQDLLDMVYRDSKAFGGYIPDLMALMRNHVSTELDEANLQALRAILGQLQLLTRILLMILIIPQYQDHEDLINTFNGYRQTLTFVEDYLNSCN